MRNPISQTDHPMKPRRNQMMTNDLGPFVIHPLKFHGLGPLETIWFEKVLGVDGHCGGSSCHVIAGFSETESPSVALTISLLFLPTQF